MAFAADDEVVIHETSDLEKIFAPVRLGKVEMPDTLGENGVWIGYLAYEAYSLNPLIPVKPTHRPPYPLGLFRRYPSFVRCAWGKTFFISSASVAEKILEDVLKRAAENFLPAAGIKLKAELEPNVSRPRYARDFEQIQESLKKGDYFELNYSINFAASFSGDALTTYLSLRHIARAPMMFFGRFPDLTILSASPESFFKIGGEKITTTPIKGTRQRGEKPTEDAQLQKTLLHSEKDGAELMMVTDMLRHDIGRVCRTGSVAVAHTKKLLSLPQYHHLCAEISGTLNHNTTLHDVFCALFPGGSVTGAPKIQVISQIDVLENRARGIYTGALGYFTPDGEANFNIPIRTIALQEDRLSFSCGGGIVVDSRCDEEYAECLLKATALTAALTNCRGTIYGAPSSGPINRTPTG